MNKKHKRYPKYLNIKAMLADSANQYGNKTYLRYFDNENNICDLSFAGFADKVKALSTYLLSKGDRVKRIAILSENRYEWIIAYVASIASGKVVIPLDKDLHFEQAVAFLRLSDADTLFYSSKFESDVRKSLTDDKSLKKIICFDKTEKGNRFTYFSACIDKGVSLLSGGNNLYDKLRTNSSELREILFTSGTTGTSKGVMLSEDNIMACIYAASNMVDISDKDTVLSVLPFHHTYEASCGILTPICLGTTVCINNNLKYVTRNMGVFKPTAMVLVPLFVATIYKKIKNEIQKAKKEKLVSGVVKVSNLSRKVGVDVRRLAFSSIHKPLGGNLRTIICGGAALDPQLVKDFENIGINIFQGYGITECAPLVSVIPYNKYNPQSVGLPIEGSVVKIISEDSDGDEIDLQAGEIGEICVKGPHVMLGYYKNDEANKEAFTKEGFFKTGDYGYIDSDGYIYITGRKKNIIILENGKNVYPEEIEEYLGRIDLISECAVVSRTVDGEEMITAVVFPDYSKFEGKSTSEIKDEIKKAIVAVNKTLPAFKQVRNIEIKKSEFEKTTTKKIIRSKI